MTELEKFKRDNKKYIKKREQWHSNLMSLNLGMLIIAVIFLIFLIFFLR